MKNPIDSIRDAISGDVAKQAGVAGDAALDAALKQAPIVDALVNGEEVELQIAPIVIPPIVIPPIKIRLVRTGK